MFEEFRLKIIDKTYANHTGQIGPIDFVNGIAVNTVKRYGAIAFNAGYRCVIVDDEGKTILEFVNGMLPMSAAEMAPSTMVQLELKLPVGKNPVDLKFDASVKSYTREQLEKVADKLGLKGLREIAEKMDVRGKSIPQLIDRILKK